MTVGRSRTRLVRVAELTERIMENCRWVWRICAYPHRDVPREDVGVFVALVLVVWSTVSQHPMSP